MREGDEVGMLGDREGGVEGGALAGEGKRERHERIVSSSVQRRFENNHEGLRIKN